MKDIVIFPGEIGVFFEKEIEYIKNHFNIIAIITYASKSNIETEILNKHGLNSSIVYRTGNINLNFIKIIKWMIKSNIFKDINKNSSSKAHKFKRFLYAVMYGMHMLNVEKILELLNTDNDNLVLYSFWSTRSAYAISYLKSKFVGAKCVCRAHGYDLYVERNVLRYLPFRDVINNYMDKIYFISNQGMQYFKKNYKEPDNKEVSYLGTKNTKKITKTILLKNNICIASCSSVIEVKRLDYIIECLKYMNGVNIEWVHLGDGSLIDDMKNLAENKLKDTTVTYKFLGNIHNDNILDTYKKYDVDFLINLSDSEGLPVSIMEAFSVSIPVIARNVGGIKEIVDNSCGLLLPEKWEDINLEDVKRFVMSRIENEKKYETLSKNCLRCWKEKFSADNNYNEFCEKIKKL